MHLRKFFSYLVLLLFLVNTATLFAQTEKEEIKDIVSKYYGEWNDSSYPGLITSRVPNTALLGNGDVGVASGGNAMTKSFYISKGDFWAYRGSPVSIGGITINEYNYEDNIDPQKTSLALDKSITSSPSHPSFPANRLNNGNWAAGYEGWVSEVNTNAATNPFWVEIDLGARRAFNRIILRHDAAARAGQETNVTSDFTVSVRSSDSGDWEEIVNVKNNQASISDIILDKNASGRFVRLEITKGTQETTADSKANPRARIGQFELYFNRDLTSAASIEDNIYDLKELKKIGRYLLNTKSEQEVTVEYSTDKDTWVNIGKYTSNSKIDYSFSSITARYIRLTYKGDEKPDIKLFTETGLNREGSTIGQSGDSLHEIQDIYNAEINTTFNSGKVKLAMRTIMHATNNIILTELVSESDVPVELGATLWAKADNVSYPVTASNEENYIIVTRATPNSAKSNSSSHSSKVALASKLIGTDFVTAPGSSNGQSLIRFTIEPKQRVYLVTAIGGGGRTYDYQDNLLMEDPTGQALSILSAVSDENDVNNLWQEHENWWENYWATSYIKLDTSDPKLNTIMKYYYGAQYMLGSAIREGKVAPGLYGIWHTNDGPSWNSDYHLNYNFISTFYGVNSSNRVEQTLPAVEAILQYKEQGIANASSITELKSLRADFVDNKIAKGDIDAKNGIPNAVLYPVGIGPWGMTLDAKYHNEALNASFSAYPLIEYYNYTQDEDFLKNTLYEYLKLCVGFYEAWLEKEDGKYVLYAGYNEGSWSMNPAVELSVLKSALQNLIKASEILNLDEDKRPKWQEILNNLAPQPTAEYQGKTVYSLAEKEWSSSGWKDMSSPVPGDGNIIPMESVIPGEQIGYYSTQNELDIAKNTIDVFSTRGGWSQINNFPKIFPIAVNTRYPAQTIIDNFSTTINNQIKPNLLIEDNTHGVEKAGSVETVNNMMLVSDKGVIKVFPSWVSDKDAKFVNLREKGAFVVSSEYDAKKKDVLYVKILSEAGKRITIASPWETGISVTDQEGNPVNVTKGTAPNHSDEITFSFDTQAGKVYSIVKGEGSFINKIGKENRIQIYPNPVNAGSYVYFDTGEPVEGALEIYNPVGALLQQLSVKNKVTSVKASEIPGIYVFLFKMKDGDSKGLKVVVR